MRAVAVLTGVLELVERKMCIRDRAFGGVVAVAGTIDAALAEAIAAGPQADVIVAGAIEPDALSRLIARRKATRLLSAPPPEATQRQLRSIGGSALVQEGDRLVVPKADWTVVTKAQPTEDQWLSLIHI